VSEFVADASAILAFIRGEAGERKVAKWREQCLVATINLMEAYSRLIRYEMDPASVQQVLRETFPQTVPLERGLAEDSAALHAASRSFGLSYADCVCLVLGNHRRATVLTADRRWKDLQLGVKVELIR
jgi:PIN domain nuclease of toxin-antitoxin system